MKHQLAHPYCTHCAYDLTGLPESQGDQYKCPECGELTSKASANRVPWYLIDSRSLCLLVTLAPGMINGLFASNIDSANPVPLMLFLGATSILWIFAFALILTLHYKRWIGPKQPGDTPRLFLRIMLGSLFYLAPMSLFWWIVGKVLASGVIGV